MFKSLFLLLMGFSLTVSAANECRVTLKEIDTNTEFEFIIKEPTGKVSKFEGDIRYEHVPYMMYRMQFWTGPSHYYSDRERNSLTLDFGRKFGELEFKKKLNDHDRMYTGKWDCYKAYKFAGRSGGSDLGVSLAGQKFRIDRMYCNFIKATESKTMSELLRVNPHMYQGVCSLTVEFGAPGDNGSVRYIMDGKYEDEWEGTYYFDGRTVFVDTGTLSPKRERLSPDAKTLSIPAFIFDHRLDLKQIR